MKLKVIVTAIILSAAINRPAIALTENELLTICSRDLGLAKGKQCESCISGVVDGTGGLSSSMRLFHSKSGLYPKLFCVETATPDELVRATKAYLLKNPSTRRFNAASEVMLTLKQAFSCSN